MSAPALHNQTRASAGGRPESAVETNKSAVQAWAEAVWDRGDPVATAACQAAEIVVHSDPARGLTDGLVWPTEVAGLLRAAIPDLRCEHELLFGDGDLVTSRTVLRGTHSGGPLWGQPPSGREVALGGICAFRVRDGRVAEIWDTTDWLGLAQQVGLAPDPGADA